MTPTALLTRVGRFARWHRRGLGVLAAMICLFAILSALAPAEPESAPVVVATRALPAGSSLTSGDIQLIEMPIGLLPDQALADPDEAVGRVLTSELTQGTVLTTANILSGRDTTGGDERLVPFRVPDAAAVELLHVGDRITVVGSTMDGGSVDLATDVRVAALPVSQNTGIGGESGALVVVAADPETATRLAAASSQMRMAIVMQ
ncbi:MAG: hypothetical protein GX875_06135 [Propionibacterium sp.]|nr:hypothetical protein [Propionibacterium sp.]